ELQSFALPFFFFQAEDGIRDFHVTGVQTCALPILTLRSLGVRKSILSRLSPNSRLLHRHSRVQLSAPAARRSLRSPGTSFSTKRSEERRVGKECRSRRSRDQ